MGVWFPARAEILLFFTVSRWALGPTQLLIQRVLGTFFQGGLSGRGIKLSLKCSAEIKSVWCYTSSHLYIFIVWWLIKYRNNCTFIIIFYFYSHTISQGICQWVIHTKLMKFYVNIFLKTCAVPRMIFFCSSMLGCLPGISSKYFWNYHDKLPVAPIIIIGITSAFTFHMCCISVSRSL
jgi:hypothetical protein